MLPLTQRPLLATAADARLFADRAAELERLGRAVDLGFHSLVLGDRGSGATSLLHQLEGRLLDEGRTVHFVRVRGVDRAAELVARVRRARRGAGPASPAELSREAIVELGADADAGDRPVVVLDDTDPTAASTLFGRYRDDLWELPLVWVVGGSAARRAAYLQPPADAFFESVVELDELAEAAAAELLDRRLGAAAADSPEAGRLRQVVPVLVAATRPRTPRALLAAARDAVLSTGDVEAHLADRARLASRAAALGRPHAVLFTELEALGPASASDDELLQRLGWTRPRVVQVLKQLEEAGLVTSYTEHHGTVGRPRQLYAVPGTRPAASEGEGAP